MNQRAIRSKGEDLASAFCFAFFSLSLVFSKMIIGLGLYDFLGIDEMMRCVGIHRREFEIVVFGLLLRSEFVKQMCLPITG